MTPEIDIATYLGNTVDSLTSGTNLFYGAVLPTDDVPGLAVFVLLTGGSRPVSFLNSGTDSEHSTSIQIIVRGEKRDYPTAIALAREVYDALKYAHIPGYIDCRPLQSSPIFLGLDNDKHPNISLNFEVVYYE